MGRRYLGGKLGKVFKFVCQENGVTIKDVATKFGMSYNLASNYLSILKARGHIYSKKINSAYASRWYEKSASWEWRVTEPDARCFYWGGCRV